MKKLKGLLLVLPVLFMVAVITAPLNASAQYGEEDAQDSTTSETNTEGSTIQDKVRGRSAELRKIEDNIRQRGNSLLQEARDKVRAKTTEELQAICEQRKHGLQRKVYNLSTNAERYLNRVSTVFTKAQTFQTEKNLQVTNYLDLVAAANASKATAEASVEALRSLTPTVDCSINTVSADIAIFKAAAEQARTDLKAYKEDVKTLLAALKTAAEAARTEGGE